MRLKEGYRIQCKYDYSGEYSYFTRDKYYKVLKVLYPWGSDSPAIYYIETNMGGEFKFHQGQIKSLFYSLKEMRKMKLEELNDLNK